MAVPVGIGAEGAHAVDAAKVERAAVVRLGTHGGLRIDLHPANGVRDGLDLAEPAHGAPSGGRAFKVPPVEEVKGGKAFPGFVASLRDVLNHIGRRVRLERGGAPVGEGLGLFRGETAFVEARLEPRPGDVLRVLDDESAYRVDASEAEIVQARVDHYKLRVTRA